MNSNPGLSSLTLFRVRTYGAGRGVPLRVTITSIPFLSISSSQISDTVHTPLASQSMSSSSTFSPSILTLISSSVSGVVSLAATAGVHTLVTAGLAATAGVHTFHSPVQSASATVVSLVPLTVQ